MKQIYLHGLGQTAKCWDNIISQLNSDDQFLCPDLAGLVPAGGVDYKRLYTAFAELCNSIGEPVDLCGLSLGGVLALNYAVDYPDRTHSLALIAPQYKMPKRLLQLQNLIFRFMPASAFETAGFNKTDLIRLCRSMMELDLSRAVGKISCPVLVVCGEKDTVNKKAARGLSGMLKKGIFKEIRHAGHEVNSDAPKELAALLAAFYACIP